MEEHRPSKTSILRIVTGGQTGADRAALDAALEAGAACGGWCPADRGAEDGVIDERYPVTPLPEGGYRERTRRNVIDSDATVLLCFGDPTGGTLQTLKDCEAESRPVLRIDAATTSVDDAAARVRWFIAEHGVKTLNVAGPRASQQAEIYGFVYEVIGRVLHHAVC